MEQMKRTKSDRWHGAAADDVVDCHKLARDVLGAACDDDNGGMKAFAYLWRRFGPPLHGSDPHKELACYYLTTEDPEVCLGISVKGLGLDYCICYMAHERMYNKHRKRSSDVGNKWNKKFERWWLKRNPDIHKQIKGKKTKDIPQEIADKFWEDRKDLYKKAAKDIGPLEYPDDNTVEARHVRKVLAKALRSLVSTTVFVRDCPINLLGRQQDKDVGDSVEPSKYAGYGIPVQHIKLEPDDHEE